MSMSTVPAEQIAEWNRRDAEYRAAYLTHACGVGRHSYGDKGRDRTLLLRCDDCGAVKKLNFSEDDLRA
jgi:hypothetical protein